MMSRGRSRALAVFAAGMILSVSPASEGRAALIYDVSLGAGARFNDNLHLDPPASAETAQEGHRLPVDETIFTVTPGIEVLWDAEYDQLQLLYQGAYSMFQGDEERDALWTHAVEADVSWRRWAPFFLEAKEERKRVPRAQDENSAAWLDQIDRNQISVRTGMATAFGARSTFEVAYRGELDTYSGIEDAAAGSEEFDRVERHAGEALLRHRWSPLWESELSAAYGQVARDLSPDYTEASVAVAADQRWSERLVLRYSLEWVREEDNKPAGGQAESGTAADPVRTSLLAGAEVRGDLERGGWWRLAYQDSLDPLSDGDTLKTGRTSAGAKIQARLGSTVEIGGWRETRDYRESGREEVAWGPTLDVRWKIATWAAFDLGASWTNTIIREESLAEVEDHTIRAYAAVVMMTFSRIQLDVGYGYRDNDSTDALQSYTNNLVYALLTFHFRPVESGRLPSSAAAGLVASGAASGGVAQVDE